MNNSKKNKKVQRASFRFDKKIYEEFREYCKQEGYNQVRLIERLMREFLQESKKHDK